MIDPNEAPEGFIAVLAENGCVGCEVLGGHSCAELRCTPMDRQDMENVIFKYIKDFRIQS